MSNNHPLAVALVHGREAMGLVAAPTGRARGWVLPALCAIGMAIGVPAKADTLTVTNASVPLYDSSINVSYGGSTWSGVIAGQIVLYSTDSAMPSAPAFNVAA